MGYLDRSLASPQPRVSAEDLLRSHGPVGDIPELRVPRIRINALQTFGLCRDGSSARHERDNDRFSDQVVVQLNRQCAPLSRICLALEVPPETVVLRARVARVIRAAPFIR